MTRMPTSTSCFPPWRMTKACFRGASSAGADGVRGRSKLSPVGTPKPRSEQLAKERRAAIFTCKFNKACLQHDPRLTRELLLQLAEVGCVYGQQVITQGPGCFTAYAGNTLFDLVLLHRQQRVCRFSGVDKPPLETGRTWSTSRRRWGSAARDTEQYRQVW